MKKIFISPSTQYNNIYHDPTHNEMEVMESVAKKLVAKLSVYDVQPIMFTRAQKLAPDRPIYANANAVDYYIELHTNAYNTISGRGCETWYQTGVDKTTSVLLHSREFALKVNTEIAAITTSTSNAGDRGIKARTQRDGRDANGELRICKMPAILCEIEFHDTEIGCNWILSHLDDIATAVCKGIVKQMGLVLKPVPKPTPVPVPVKVLKVGAVIAFQPWALKYATGQWLPRFVKRSRYTVQEVSPKTGKITKVLLKEIKSWVYARDIKVV